MEQLIKKNKLNFWWLLFLFSCGVLKTEAHPMPNSILKLFVLENSIKGEAYIPILELENALGNNKDKLSDKSFIRNYFFKTHSSKILKN